MCALNNPLSMLASFCQTLDAQFDQVHRLTNPNRNMVLTWYYYSSLILSICVGITITSYPGIVAVTFYFGQEFITLNSRYRMKYESGRESCMSVLEGYHRFLSVHEFDTFKD